ncbi:MAG: hypothetical protein MI784_15585 [Cytophagales bacterium]|nr:hypothetical protein [Cytophagales bacterium]
MSHGSLFPGGKFDPPKSETPPFSLVQELLKKKRYEDVLRAYNYNWFDVKEHLAYQKYAADEQDYYSRLDVMDLLIEFRTVEVGRLLNETHSYLSRLLEDEQGKGVSVRLVRKEPGCDFLDIGGQAVIVSVPGSTQQTSDYDITITIPGREDLEIEAVCYFNKVFRNAWEGRSSGMVFDTNIYTSGFMSSFHQAKHASLFRGHELMYRKVKAEKHLAQMALSFLPIRQFFYLTKESHGGWQGFKSNVMRKLLAFLGKEKEWDAEELDFLVQRNLNNVFNTTQILHGETFGRMSNELKKMRESSPNRALDPAHSEAIVRDSLYEQELQGIKHLIADRKRILEDVHSISRRWLHPQRLRRLLESLRDNLKAYNEMQGRALVFANEAYYNEGAVFHVVEGMQRKQEISLGRQVQMQSMLMNVGYKLLHFHLHHQEGGYGRAYINTAKYGQRIQDIVTQNYSASETAKLDKDEFEIPDLGHMLFEVMTEQMELLEAEERLILYYKKNPDLTTPSAKEEAAERDFWGDTAPKKFFKQDIEEHYICIAENVLAPFYLDKLRKRGLSILGKGFTLEK